jgi:uncharacterized protein (TIGR03435 family)
MNPEKNINEILERYITSASNEEVDSHCEHVFQHLQSRRPQAVPQGRQEGNVDFTVLSFLPWRRISMVSAAAAVALAVFVGVWWRSGSPAVVESVDGGLYRVVEGKNQFLGVSERLETGETIHSNGGSGGTLVLADGSRVEMRSQSELSFERTDDGMRILLSNGGVIVNAAKQREGRHLYVQTKDLTVSVVGTVFLVNAEEGGSRVAVIEGEVRVKQGSTEKKLRPGEQVTTNPSTMLSIPVREEISWSRQAETHVALLQQAVSPTGVDAASEAFEVASIRINPGRGKAGSGERGQAPTGPSGGGPCSGSRIQVDPKRFAIHDAGIYTLIMLAYAPQDSVWSTNTMTPAGDCERHWAPNGTWGVGRLSGGPEWIQSNTFDIEALLPEGPSPYTTFTKDAYQISPRLQRMLQALLEERFKLVLRRQKKEMPGHVLSVAQGGPKLTAWKEGEEDALTPGTSIRPHAATGSGKYGGRLNSPSRHNYADDLIVGQISGGKQSMPDMARLLERITKKPVLDRTGITGAFNFEIFFAPAEFWTIPDNSFVLNKPSLVEVLEEELGLKFEAGRVPVDALVIESVEKPSQN